jgi:hypothetical protein
VSRHPTGGSGGSGGFSSGSSGGGGQIAVVGPAVDGHPGGGPGSDPIQPAVVPVVGTGFEAIISDVAANIRTTVKPAAAAAVATEFSFPLILMIAVLLFLLIQSRLDGRDPKLRAAPLTSAETILPFRDEDQL